MVKWVTGNMLRSYRGQGIILQKYFPRSNQMSLSRVWWGQKKNTFSDRLSPQLNWLSDLGQVTSFLGLGLQHSQWGVWTRRLYKITSSSDTWWICGMEFLLLSLILHSISLKLEFLPSRWLWCIFLNWEAHSMSINITLIHNFNAFVVVYWVCTQFCFKSCFNQSCFILLNCFWICFHEYLCTHIIVPCSIIF